MIRLILLFLCFVFKVNAQKTSITIASASNMKNVLTEIIANYSKLNPVKVDVVYGSSGKLVAQISEGAPYDIFISADTEYPTALYTQKLTLTKPKVYALGSLVFWTLNKEADIECWEKFIQKPENKFIALPNPNLAPYGRAAVEALKRKKVYESLKNRFVIGENVSQTAQFITSGNANCGFVAKSIVLSENMLQVGKWVDVARNNYKPIYQSSVILNHAVGAKQEEIFNFYKFFLSKENKGIFEKYGYLMP